MMQVFGINIDNMLTTNIINATVLIFCPLAGFLADTKFSRFKTMVTSTYLLILSLIMITIIEGLAIPHVYCFLVSGDDSACYHDTSITVVRVLFWIGLILSLLLGIIFSFGYTGFIANAIQFGIDQLHDSPVEDQSLFIHWMIWVYYVKSFIDSLFLELMKLEPIYIGLTVQFLMPLLVTALLLFSLCLTHYKKRWFLIEQKRINPYMLVYKVTKFAYKHRTPVRRSAFTYCEDEVPSGLNLGKNKYGGPFTTEEVEDVKAFYGILKVVFSSGTVYLYFFFMVTNSTLPPFDATVIIANFTHVEKILVTEPVLIYSIAAICIPLYLFLLRPFVSYYVPGTLKRMGISTFLLLVSFVYCFSVNIAVYFKSAEISRNETSSLDASVLSSQSTMDIYVSTYILQSIASSLSQMLFTVAIFEFICSQSPHPMKGLLIGLHFATRGLSSFVGTVLLQVFEVLTHKLNYDFPIAGCVYYLLNVVLSFTTLLIYVCIARKYKYRERDEPCKERQYAEEYYSKTLVDFTDSQPVLKKEYTVLHYDCDEWK